jgi:hypothetical protein
VWVYVIVVANCAVIEEDTFITRDIVSESYVMISVSHANVEIYDIIPYNILLSSLLSDTCNLLLVTITQSNTDFNYYDQHLSTPFS